MMMIIIITAATLRPKSGPITSANTRTYVELLIGPPIQVVDMGGLVLKGGRHTRVSEYSHIIILHILQEAHARQIESNHKQPHLQKLTFVRIHIQTSIIYNSYLIDQFLTIHIYNSYLIIYVTLIHQSLLIIHNLLRSLRYNPYYHTTFQ
ncbi:hypothetical protein HanXRQr2_Chr11g0470871 [Helianthus annuus]|uniref:Uncharacterized protein n=1 Tax=Helianthus annuus TaxID=4232 RepID=A0A9K3MYH8_HELAN|nr:hypothetical protein HanXRQr2_Chr11g0470871 [Helianthus annuus]KAJ0873569.1 hypothetical protein HanPSC8_Chr11g0453951 [Helianthus annuus]